MKNLIVMLAVFFGLMQQAAAQCDTDAGTIQPDQITACIGDYVHVVHNGDQFLEANDVLKFVVHDGTETSLGNILQYYPGDWFYLDMPGNVIPGVTYQVAVVAGNPDGNGAIDLTDPCLSFSGGFTATWYAPPTLQLPDVFIACEEFEAELFITPDPPVGQYAFYTDNLQGIGINPVGQTLTLTQGGWLGILVEDQFSHCWVEDTIIVSLATGKPFVMIDQLTGGDCGQLNVAVATNGGVLPISFQWSNGETNPELTLTPGSYCVSVTSGNGCVGQDCIVVSEPADFDLSLSFFQSDNCGQSRLEANVTGAAGNVSYQWSSGSVTTSTNSNFSLGQNYVTVTDNAGCESVASYYVETAPTQCGNLNIRVFDDLDLNCLFNGNDFLLENLKLSITDPSQNVQYVFTHHDLFGYSWSGKLNPGTYTVAVELPSAMWQGCQPSYTLTLAEGATATLDIPLQPVVSCTDLRVDLASLAELNWCSPNNYASLYYENKGTQEAADAYVELQLEPFLTLTSSSEPFTALGNDLYRFDLGTVGVGAFGKIYLNIKVECDATLGSTPCLQATIFPNTPCPMFTGGWSGASLKLTSDCQSDGVHFFIENIGTADMTVPLEYVIIEDAVMFMQAPADPPLQQGQIKELTVPANGATWRLEVEQEPLHPGFSMPALAVEGCTAFGSQGFVNLFPQDDADSYLDIECVEITGAYDPNDKVGLPLGFGDQHLIEPGTDIEYTIRFQNTGNDTAETVVIRDTLSPWLDPLSVEPGASSHPYRFDYYGEGGNLRFVFENIMLLDSNINEPASHGFVSFKVKHRPEAAIGTDIFNTAAIFFDHNPPIFTNTTQHRLGVNFILSADWAPVAEGLELAVFPNPMADEARVEISGWEGNGLLSLELYDLLGKRLQRMDSKSGSFVLSRGSLPSGLYTLRVLSAGRVLGNGKLVVR